MTHGIATPTTGKHGRGRFILLAASAALALALGAGIGAWQAHSQSQSHRAPPASALQASTAPMPRPAQGTASVVLVRSARDAADLEAQLSASANLSPWQAPPPQIIVVPDGASADFIRSQIDLANEERAAHGLREIVVTDMTQPLVSPARQNPAAPAIPDLSALTDPQSYARWLASHTPTLYLVGTPEQATILQATLNDTDAMRAQFGGPSLDISVRVVDATTAEELQQDIASQNGFRAVLGLPPIAVHDLRQSAAAPAWLNRPPGGAGPLVMDRQ